MEKNRRSVLMVGKKVGMTQLYSAVGVLRPVTVIEMCKAFVADVRSVDSDGYFAVVFGFLNRKTWENSGGKKVSSFDILKELRVGGVEGYERGESVSVKEFAEGEYVDVVGISKGKGFQGVMKRHGFSGGPASHGSMFHRRGGSYGQRQWPGHTFRGRKMPGHMGDERCTVQNLVVASANEDKNLLVIEGSCPGARGGYVIVRRAKKCCGVKNES
ncbi:MAG: 50S ribosomal protein L3 [Puniceicoccales bacterium]|jgi:large subunit ribosomal protein L3|nr:50S ribosomal protein L3 [Puniceicoccales bacterium]